MNGISPSAGDEAAVARWFRRSPGLASMVVARNRIGRDHGRDVCS